jgi:hypothetical protein
VYHCGPGVTVGLEIDSLRAGWSEDRNLLGGKVFCYNPDRPKNTLNLLYDGKQVSVSGRGVEQPTPPGLKK